MLPSNIPSSTARGHCVHKPLNSGAGIQADLKTFTSLETFGTSVITSVTSQNTLTVDGIHPIPAAFVVQQLEAVLSDIGTHAIKTGSCCNQMAIAQFVNAASRKSEFMTCTSSIHVLTRSILQECCAMLRSSLLSPKLCPSSTPRAALSPTWLLILS